MSVGKRIVTIHVPKNLVRQAVQIIYDEILLHVQYHPAGEKDWQEAVKQTMRFNGIDVDGQDTTQTVLQQEQTQ